MRPPVQSTGQPLWTDVSLSTTKQEEAATLILVPRSAAASTIRDVLATQRRSEGVVHTVSSRKHVCQNSETHRKKVAHTRVMMTPSSCDRIGSPTKHVPLTLPVGLICQRMPFTAMSMPASILRRKCPHNEKNPHPQHIREAPTTPMFKLQARSFTSSTAKT